MPVYKCPNNKWRIGNGPCMYTSKAAADRAYRAYQIKKHLKRFLEEHPRNEQQPSED